MFRFSLFSALLAVSACGGANPSTSDSQTPFLNLPMTPGGTGGGTAGGGTAGGGTAGGGTAGGGTAGGGTGSNTGGGLGTGGGMPANSENIAEKVWNAQADVSTSATHFSSTYGANAFSWLRAAKTAAGAQVTTGTVTVLADGSTRYAPGGSTLKLVKPGYTGELRVDALSGDISATTFPAAGESIDVTWLFSNGKAAHCVLMRDEMHFEGTFLDEHEDEAHVRVSWYRSAESSLYQDASGIYVTSVVGSVDSTGEHIYSDGRRVNFAMHEDYSACITAGSSCYGPRSDYRYEHNVSVQIGNAAWELVYVTGWKQQSIGSLNIKYWGGSIDGPDSGAFIVRPVGPVFGLDVRIGADTFNADSAQAVSQ